MWQLGTNPNVYKKILGKSTIHLAILSYTTLLLKYYINSLYMIDTTEMIEVHRNITNIIARR